MEEDRITGEIAGKLKDAAAGGADAKELTAIEADYAGSVPPVWIRNAEARAIAELQAAVRTLKSIADASFS